MAKEIVLDAEDLGTFSSALTSLLKTSLFVLGRLEDYDLVGHQKDQIETIFKRARLYRSHFNRTSAKDMCVHYNPFHEVYLNNVKDIQEMASAFNTEDGVVKMTWITKGKLNITINAKGGIVLHLREIYKLAVRLRNAADKDITHEYSEKIAKGGDEAQLNEDMLHEKSRSAELNSLDNFLLSLFDIFIAICQNRDERENLKAAASIIEESIPQETSSDGFNGLLGNFGSIISDVLGGLPKDGNMDGANIGDVVSNTVQAALGGEGPIREILERTGNSKTLPELTKNIGDAFNNPELSKTLQSQVDRYGKNSGVAPPPKAGDPIPSAAAEPKKLEESEPQVVQETDDVDFGD